MAYPPWYNSAMVWRCALFLSVVAGCTGSRAAPEPDAQFGHRYDNPAPDGSHTIVTTPTLEGETYRIYPASFEAVVVRPAPFVRTVPADTQTVAVEVLIKGALPDACMQLHDFGQERAGNIIRATLQMRRAQSAMCASARRPYRFYVMLEGRYGPGHYTLQLNGEAISFRIRVPPS